MKTRTESPFPTRQCDDDNCSRNVPKSTGRELCRTCSNVRQILGKRPSDVDTADIQKIENEYRSDSYGFVLTVDGTEKEPHWYHDPKYRNSRYGEYRIAVKQAIDD